MIYIALLRGINVGGRNKLPMRALVELLEEEGCHNVRTYIQSGNVVFESKPQPGDLGGLIKSRFGFRPEVILLKAKEFQVALNKLPFDSDDGKTIHCYFCNDSPRPDFDRIGALKSASEQYALVDKAFYLFAPDGIGRSKLVADIDRCLGVPATGRNLNTLRKLQELSKDDC